MDINEKLVHIKTGNCADASAELLKLQLLDWEQCARGYASLSTVEIKKFEFDGFNINVQFNPGRIISSSAKVDPKSIKERKCFLCMENLPPQQKGILYRDHYIILINPFPIFPEHFTIPSVEHKPQAVYSSFNDFLSLTKDLSGRYLVFYNGPKCGASAPDHFHFQAGNNDFLPLLTGYRNLKQKYAHIIYSGRYEVLWFNDLLRKVIIIEGDTLSDIISGFELIYEQLVQISPPGEEPMMNIISGYSDGKWIVMIILREKHRPARFFDEGENNLLLSPAAVDLGGVCITPLEKDFNKIAKDDLVQIFNEVILNEEKFSFLVKGLRGAF